MATPENDPGNAADHWDDNDFTPSPRVALHENQKLCKKNLESIVWCVPVEIRASNICMGSGLFVGEGISAGREIYHVTPTMHVLDATNASICFYCLVDTQEVMGGANKANQKTMACASCRVARFCSKKCQKAAWHRYHKDECKILQRAPRMSEQNLMTHRLIFWQQRGFIETSLAESLMCLEDHFHEYSKHPNRATELMDMALAVREGTGNRVSLNVPWRLGPALRINCVPLRSPSKRDPVGYAFDVVTAMINHSCDPNAHVFFEGDQLRVRSLKDIAAGEEITISYVPPMLNVANRKILLDHMFFFDCYCTRCKTELKEQCDLLGDSKQLRALQHARSHILKLVNAAVRASKYHGIYPDDENLANVETRLRTILVGAFPRNKSWPDSMDPLPCARLSLGMLYLGQGQPVPALRSVLKGALFNTRKDDPEFVNDMMDVVTVLMVAGSLPADAPAFKDKSFPSVDDLRTVAYGYLLETAHKAAKAFGYDAEYAKGVIDMMSVMATKKPGSAPGSKEFMAEYEPAQRKLLAWAGVPEENGIVITNAQK